MEGSFGFEQAIDELAEVARPRPARAAPQERDRGRPGQRPAVHLEGPAPGDGPRAAELAGWEYRHALAATEHPDGRMRGLGGASQIWWGGGGPPAHALVRLGSDGVATVVTGTQDIGTGIYDRARPGGGRGARPAARPGARRDRHDPLRRLRPGLRAARRRRPRWRRRCAPRPTTCGLKLHALASDLFEVSPDDLELRDGEIRSKDGALRKPLAEITGKLGHAQLVGTGSRGPNPEGMRDQHVRLPDRPGRGRRRRPARSRSSGSSRCTTSAACSTRSTPRARSRAGSSRRSASRSSEERVVDPTTGSVVNGEPRGLQAPDDGRRARDHRRVRSTTPTRTSRRWA